MTVPALALVPVLIDDTGTSANAGTATLHDQLLRRASQPGYQHWLSIASAAGGSVRPIRLRGTARDVETTTGEILRTLDTTQTPDGVIYTCCGDRRASVCPPCARAREHWRIARQESAALA